MTSEQEPEPFSWEEKMVKWKLSGPECISGAPSWQDGQGGLGQDIFKAENKTKQNKYEEQSFKEWKASKYSGRKD